MALLRTRGLRSAVQNCSAETAAFYMEYSHAKGQYCKAFMVVSCKIIQCFLVYMVTAGSGMKEFQFAFELVDPSCWHVSFDVVVHAFYVCISSKVKIFCSLCVNLEVHILIMQSSGYCPSIVKLSFP